MAFQSFSSYRIYEQRRNGAEERTTMQNIGWLGLAFLDTVDTSTLILASSNNLINLSLYAIPNLSPFSSPHPNPRCLA
jgi:hypothetical protein